MLSLTDLELTALNAIFEEADKQESALASRVYSSQVVKRENTGGGFFTTLAVQQVEAARESVNHFGRDVWMSIEGLQFGLGMILHLKDGSKMLLEGYAVGPENTAPINFEKAQFATSDEPAPLLSDAN